MTRFVSTFSMLAVAAAPLFVANTAVADVPSCSGNDMPGAARAERVGLQHYRAATATATINRVEMAAALEAFDTQCRAGDARALERRAYALNALGRTVEAAETLDAYLLLRPLHTFEAAQRTQIAQQQAAILATVGTLVVEAPVPGAMVIVNGRSYGTLPRGPIRVEPGELNIQVIVSSSAPLTRSVRISAGEMRRELFNIAISSGSQSTSVGTSGRQTTTSNTNNTSNTTNATNTATQSTTNLQDGSQSTGGSTQVIIPPVVQEPVARGPRPTPVLTIAFGTGAIAAGIATLGATLWRGNRVAEYDNNCTGTAADPPECMTVAGERDASQTLQLAAGITAGALTVATGIALGIWLATPGPAIRPTTARLILTPGLTQTTVDVFWRF